MRNFLKLILFFWMVIQPNLALSIPTKHTTDEIQFGRVDANPKVIEALNGIDPNNPTIIADPVQDDWNFNKDVNIEGNNLKLGDGADSDKNLTFDVGNGVTNPKLKWNSVTDTIQFCNEGDSSCVDLGSGGLKESVRVATNSNINIASAPSSIDGVTLASNDRVLLINQSIGSENGLWVFNGASSALTRPSDFANASEQDSGVAVYVKEGTFGIGDIFVLVDGVVVDTDAPNFVAAGPKRDLSNLKTTSINQHLLPDSDSVRDLGSTSLVWNQLYADQAVLGGGSFDGKIELKDSNALYHGEITVDDGSSAFHIISDGNQGPMKITSSFSSSGGNSGIEISSGGGSGAFQTKDISVVTGDNSGTGDSGNLTFQTGTVTSGTRGKISLIDGSEGNIGDVWTSTGINGEGEWSTLSAGANTTLSNLTSPTSINQDLIPDSNDTRDLGTAANSWQTVNTEGLSINENGSLRGALSHNLTFGNETLLTGVEGLLLRSGASATISADTKDVLLGSGVASGSFNTGDVILQPGTVVSGTRGKIKFKDGTEGTSGQCWVSSGTDGEGEWVACPGGGSSSGINIIENANFEQGNPVTDWSETGGTFSTETASPLFGVQSGKWDAGALGQELQSTTVAVPAGFVGRSCSAKIEYKWPSGNSGDLVFVIDDGAGNDLFTLDLDPTSGSNSKQALIADFTCPTGNIRMLLEAAVADPAEITVDEAFFGIGFGSKVSQTILIADAHYPTAANCIWTRTSSSFGLFTSDTDCPSISVDFQTSEVDTTDNDQPDIKFNKLDAGTYHAKWSGHITQSISQTVGFKITESVSGQSSSAECGRRAEDTNVVSHVTCTATFTFTEAGPRTFNVLGFQGGGANVNIRNDNNGFETHWTIWKVPSSDEEIVELKTSEFVARGYMSGSALIFSGASSVAFAPISDTDLTMTNLEGSAFIACDDSEAPNSTTCSSGSEQIGFGVNLDEAGSYDVCFDIPLQFNSINAANTATVSSTFKIVKTSNTAGGTVLEESLPAVSGPGEVASNARAMGMDTVNICRKFNTVTVGLNTFRIHWSRNLSEANTDYQFNWDDPATNGARGRAVYFSIKKSSGEPTVSFPKIDAALSTKLENPEHTIKTCHIFLDFEDSSFNDFGNCIDSITDNDVGNQTLNFVAGYWGSPGPICTCTNRGGTAAYCSNNGGVALSTSTYTVIIKTDAGVLSDGRALINCFGVAP